MLLVSMLENKSVISQPSLPLSLKMKLEMKPHALSFFMVQVSASMAMMKRYGESCHLSLTL